MIRINNGNLQIEAGYFSGQIDVSTSDGDANSKNLLGFLQRIFDKAADDSITIFFDEGGPRQATTPIDLAEAIHAALVEDDPTAFIGEFNSDSRTTVDGRFEFMMVAERVLRKLRDPAFLRRYQKS